MLAGERERTRCDPVLTGHGRTSMAAKMTAANPKKTIEESYSRAMTMDLDNKTATTGPLRQD